MNQTHKKIRPAWINSSTFNRCAECESVTVYGICFKCDKESAKGSCKRCSSITMRGICLRCGWASICSVCRKIKQIDGNYLMGAFEEQFVSHGYCPDCAKAELESAI